MILPTLALLLGQSLASSNTYMTTDTFGPMSYHEKPAFSPTKIAGTIVGFVVFGAILLLTTGLLIVEMKRRRDGFWQDVREKELRMRQIGID